MKVIAINGSPRKEGNTAVVLREMCAELQAAGISTEIIQIGEKAIRGCIACMHCRGSAENRCVFGDDPVNEVAQKMRDTDGFILGSPTYYGGVAGTMKSFLDRAFYSSAPYFRGKVATAVTVVRRSGGVDAHNQLTNFLKLAQTVTPPSHYWLTVYGQKPGEVQKDLEGMQNARMHARSMAWLMKSLEVGSATVEKPDLEERVMMNFIRG